MKKYYLGFTFSPEKTVGLHCTHCYFGKLDEVAVRNVMYMVDDFFALFNPVTVPEVVFDIPAIFGGETRIRVLVTKTLDVFEPFKELRETFEEMGLIKSEFPFRPHVTCATASVVRGPFHSYALVSGSEVVKSWPLKQTMEATG